ncbi:hypothetical protein N7535_002017 [Penicillium sp. DV-2018c]|nr:hypothetical protein N7535_002017 [Penicillium sp. DV-2018c]
MPWGYSLGGRTGHGSPSLADRSSSYKLRGRPSQSQQPSYQSPRVYFTETPVDDLSRHDGDQYDCYAEEDLHLPDLGVPPHQSVPFDSARGMTDQQNETPTEEFPTYERATHGPEISPGSFR